MDDQWNQNPGGQAPADPSQAPMPAGQPDPTGGAQPGAWTPPVDPNQGGGMPAPEPTTPPADPTQPVQGWTPPAPVDPNAGQVGGDQGGTDQGGTV